MQWFEIVAAFALLFSAILVSYALVHVVAIVLGRAISHWQMLKKYRDRR